MNDSGSRASGRIPDGSDADVAVTREDENENGSVTDPSLISLVLRGDKLPLRNAIASCFNDVVQQLVVVTAPALFLYGNLLELGGELVKMILADENVQFQSAFLLPWVDGYGVVATNRCGYIEHRLVSADFSECHLTHLIAEQGLFYAAIANPFRHEVVTTDSDGGFKVWVLRSPGALNSSKAAPAWKGFQRIHAGSRKTTYKHVLLASDDQTILACTKTRIHAFDSTTCARMGTLYSDASCVIVGVVSDRERNDVYLQIDDSRSRLVYRLQGSLLRGRLHSLEVIAVYGGGEDIVAFDAITRGNLSADSVQQHDGIFALDALGKLSVASCSPSIESGVVDQCSVSLPLAPSAEVYAAVHAQTHQDESRNFALVVSSSGFIVVEVVLADASMPARRLTTNVAATKITMLEVDEQQRIAIFNSSPPSILLFDEANFDSFIAILLPVPPSDEDQIGVNQSTLNAVVDFTALCFGVVVVWTSGDVTHYCLRTQRTSFVGRVRGVPVVVKAAISSSQDEWIFFGDDRGAVTLWAFQKDSENSKKDIAVVQVCTKNAHNERILSISTIRAGSLDSSAYVVTVAIDGEVKLWRLRELKELIVTWDLLVCFRTYATAISATALLGPEFLFCGSEEGGLECWRLPVVSLAQPLDHHSGRGQVAVLKRPLHSIDLHLTRVCQIMIEPRDAAKRVSAAHPLMDDFAWVITYDVDCNVLVWCFSTTFLFPHRKLRPHTLPIGGFLSAVDESTFHFYAYLGRCLDRIDVAAEIDRIAVKKRLVQARQSENAATDNKKPHTSIHYSDARPHADGSDSSNAVRLQITLPSVTQVDALADLDTPSPQCNSPPKFPRLNATREYEDILHETRASDASAVDDANLGLDLWSEGHALSPTPTRNRDVPQVASHEIKKQLRKAVSRQSALRPTASFAPDTVPSQFQKAKPRVYRTNHRPITNTNQSRCSVVTSTIGADVGHSPPMINTATENGSRDGQRWEGEAQRQQDRVAIVTVTDADLAGQLRLDFRSSKSTRRKPVNEDGTSPGRSSQPSTTHFIPWTSLTKEYQLVELMAATRSRFIVQEAVEDTVSLPNQADFANSDVKAHHKIRAFSRWYLSSQQARQSNREAFLREELRCAVGDAAVIMAMKSAGLPVPYQDDIDDLRSPLWIQFAVWYATGNPAIGSESSLTVDDAAKRRADRLQARTSFLKQHLETLASAEREQEASLLLSTDDGPYIFDVDQSISGSDPVVDAAAWGQLSTESRRCELLLALDDPMIQVAALADGVELPDTAMCHLDAIDICSLAASFTLWWTTASNIHRLEFLNHELAEAARDQDVCGSLKNSDDSKSFRAVYFQSNSTRETFLKQKLNRKQRHNRIATIFESGKHSTPVLFEACQVPLWIPFIYPPPPTISPLISADIASVEAVLKPQNEEDLDETTPIEDAACDSDESADDKYRQTAELAFMAIEDELSKELNDGYESASDDDHDDEHISIEPPKRKDFTNAYFFANLPKTFRVNAGGWIAGSGLDNGDEELEEEERLEKERQHQESLDRLEAERIADAERQAERMRHEKEVDEKALQMKRLRQAELRKILAHQAELEAQRLEQDQHHNMLREQAAMEDEERQTTAWLESVEMERAAMQREDRLAAQIALAERTARRDEMRRVLAEMTQMDAEDRRSALAQAAQLELEHQQRLRVQYLTEVYAPFEPFFSESKSPSEEMLPVITRRPKQSSKSRQQGGYALSMSETLALDENVEQEQYAVRESRKLRQLMGLPVSTPHSRRMMRIPSERDIIKTRHDLQLKLPPTYRVEEDRLDIRDSNGNAFSPTRKTGFSTQADRQQKRARLPELAQWKAHSDDPRLTDLTATPSAASPNQHENSTKPLTQRAVDQPARQKTALPFFRGNFIVEGSRPRSQAYIPK